MVGREAFPGDQKCQKCQVTDGCYRCTQCFGEPIWCTACCLEIHQQIPFHRIKKWNGSFFERSDLDDAGLTIFLGHGGQPCPSVKQVSATKQSDKDDDGMDIDSELQDTDVADGEIQDANAAADGGIWEDVTADKQSLGGDRLKCVDSAGIFIRRIRWCECLGEDRQPLRRDIQLLGSHLYPATSEKPSTIFTFNVLDEFLLDAMECKTAAMNFFNKLRRLTNNVFPHSVSVSVLHGLNIF